MACASRWRPLNRDRQGAWPILAFGTAADVRVEAVGAVLMPAHRAAQHIDALAFRSADVCLPDNFLPVRIAIADSRDVFPRRGLRCHHVVLSARTRQLLIDLPG